MKISSISGFVNKFSSPKTNKKTSFKGIYLHNDINIGQDKVRMPVKFSREDSLILDEMSREYPYQDCFIKAGSNDKLPRLEFRERPIDIPNFTTSLTGYDYKITVDSLDKDYPTVPLILDGTNEMSNYIGKPSYSLSSPSLLYTIRMGFELHKRLLAKKKEILESMGKNDGIDNREILEMAYRDADIQHAEKAVQRHLLEQAYLSKLEKGNYGDLSEGFEKQKAGSVLYEKRRNGMCDTASTAIEQAITDYPNDVENEMVIPKLMDALIPDYTIHE